jgi:hypothetical protein
MLAASSGAVATVHRVNCRDGCFKDCTTTSSVLRGSARIPGTERGDGRSRTETGYVWWRRRRHWVMCTRGMIARSKLLKAVIAAWVSIVSGRSTEW